MALEHKKFRPAAAAAWLIAASMIALLLYFAYLWYQKRPTAEPVAAALFHSIAETDPQGPLVGGPIASARDSVRTGRSIAASLSP